MTRKYHNAPVTYDGHDFDSQAEMRRYVWLRQAERDGDIRDLRVHPRYVLLDAQPGQRAVSYEGDFEYIDNHSGQQVTEDVKGVETQVFKIKAKLFRARWGHFYELRVIPSRDC